jgi:hypothetical protein
MRTLKASPYCQCQCFPRLSVANIEYRPRSIFLQIKLLLKRSVSGASKRRLKKISDRVINIYFNKGVKNSRSEESYDGAHPKFSKGDLVRIRSEEEINATLNIWGELKGCRFMDAQRQYFNTIQRVLKPVTRFVDERDYRVKRSEGIVLLEGIICEGTPEYGRCDRACYYFWREEWLERLDDHGGKLEDSPDT